MLVGLGLLIATTLLAPIAYRVLKARFGYIVTALSSAFFLYFVLQLPVIARGEPRVEALPWFPSAGIALAFRLDGLALLFALLITGIGALIALYAVSYFANSPKNPHFWTAFLLFETAMLGLVLADDLITLFVFWELTSIASFFLIGLSHERAIARSNAQQALVVTGAGGLALLAAALLLAQQRSTFRVSSLLDGGPLAPDDTLTAAILLLALLAAATKSAQVPFHFWLPNAMVAPTPVSAYLHSATMVKAGVYLLARLNPLFVDHPWWQPSLLIVGGTTAVTGALLAVVQRDLKRMLAYSTISALGTLVFALGNGPAVHKAFTLFLLAHALYKGGAFLVAGIVEHTTHTRQLDELAGLMRSLPTVAVTTVFVVVAALGLPPSLGFLAKETVLEGSLETTARGGPVIVTAALVGQGAVAWLLLRPFLARTRITPVDHRPSVKLLTGPLLLGLGATLAGLTNSLLGPFLGEVISSITGTPAESVTVALWHGFNMVFFWSAGLIAAGALLALAWPALVRAGDRTGVTEALEGSQVGLAKWGPEGWYYRALVLLTRLAVLQTRLLQNGFLRLYITTIVLTLLVLAALSLARHPLPARPLLAPLTPLELLDLVLATVIVVSALVAVRASERLAAIAAVGALGYSLALLFARFGAPDLAITQVAVDTLAVVLLVFAFYRLPRYARLSTPRARSRDFVLASAFGLTMGSLALVASMLRHPGTLSTFFAESAYREAHGRNVVNVILVDFRALDTLGEITVLGIAAVGVAALLSRRREREGKAR